MRPLHITAGGITAVVVGGVIGAAAREAVSQAVHPVGTFPLATLLINLSGALLLGLLLEALVRAGDDSGRRRRLRLAVGTGFMGAFTTYSTFAVESVQLVRHHDGAVAVLYVVVTVIGGLLAAGLGVALGARKARRPGLLEMDPDTP